MRCRKTNICTIQFGYSAPRRLNPVAAGGVPAILLRDVSPEGVADPDSLMRVLPDGPVDRYLVRAGDVVLGSRGLGIMAVALDERFQEPALAVLPLVVLRPTRDALKPEQLAKAINQSTSQRHFYRTPHGPAMRKILWAGLYAHTLVVRDLATKEMNTALDALHERVLDPSRR